MYPFELLLASPETQFARSRDQHTAHGTKGLSIITRFSKITQVIIEILVISLVEDYVARGDNSWSTNFQNGGLAMSVGVSEEEINAMMQFRKVLRMQLSRG